MRVRIFHVLAMAVFVVCVRPAFGQWLKYPTTAVPRTKDGKVNLSAPAPRRNGKPDLSGIWLTGNPMPCNKATGERFSRLRRRTAGFARGLQHRCDACPEACRIGRGR